MVAWNFPRGPGGPADEFIFHRLKQLRDGHLRRRLRDGERPEGLILSPAALSWVLGLGASVVTGLLLWMTFQGA